LSWKAQLTLHYTQQGERTSAHDLHEGPLRVLQRLYPEGPAICHHVIVHPPGGVVGGDELHVHATLAAGTHALITTPGATRFYRSEGALALQAVRLHLADGARLEWLPMETIAYSGCQARNELHAQLAPQAEMIGWDVLALGLPAAQQPYVDGCFEQHLAVSGAWLDRARVAAHDTLLLQSPLGWAGHSTLATAWFACGQALPAARRQALVDAAREAVAASPMAALAGVTAVQTGVVVARVLSHRVEPAMQLLAAVRAAWRRVAWGLDAKPPRIWRT
jgi:urease accessory protein